MIKIKAVVDPLMSVSRSAIHINRSSNKNLWKTVEAAAAAPTCMYGMWLCWLTMTQSTHNCSFSISKDCTDITKCDRNFYFAHLEHSLRRLMSHERSCRGCGAAQTAAYCTMMTLIAISAYLTSQFSWSFSCDLTSLKSSSTFKIKCVLRDFQTLACTLEKH